MPAVAKLCECGCGQPAPIVKETNRTRGYVKGAPHRFIQNHAKKGVPKSPETRAKMKAAWKDKPRPWLRKPRPSIWKDDPSGGTLHQYVKRHFPKAGVCEACGEQSKTDYAFLRHPEPYTRSRSDYSELCRSCHMRHDFRIGARTMQRDRCRHGHVLAETGMYLDGRGCRRCSECRRLRDVRLAA